MGRLAIFGAGGFGREIVRTAREQYPEIVFIDDAPLGRVFGIDVIAPELLQADDLMAIAIGSSAKRAKLSNRYPNQLRADIRAGTAIVGDDVEIGPGHILCDNSIVTASSRIGSHFLCNIYAYVAHDCTIGDNVTFGARVSCNAHVVIEDGVQIASGVVIDCGTPTRPLRIGTGAIISAGTVVTEDVPAYARR